MPPCELVNPIEVLKAYDVGFCLILMAALVLFDRLIEQKCFDFSGLPESPSFETPVRRSAYGLYLSLQRPKGWLSYEVCMAR